MNKKVKNVGDLRHRITLQGPQLVPDGIGGFTVSWVDVVSVWACIETTLKNEMNFSESVQSRLQTKITIRQNSNFTTDKRIKFVNEYFSIKAVHNIDMREWFSEIIAEKFVL